MVSNRFLAISLIVANTILCVASHVTHEWVPFVIFGVAQVLFVGVFYLFMDITYGGDKKK